MGKYEPSVSVIVPIYNVERYLRRCVKTLIAQNYSNVEILLIDDGSTDRSPLICDELANEDTRIKVYHIENSGLSGARNYGIERSKGEYIFFIDSDDYVREGLIENMVLVANENNADIVQFNYQKKYSNSKKNNWEDIHGKYTIYSHDDALQKCLDYKQINIMVWNKMYKKDLFANLRFPVGKIHEDEYILPYVIDLANKCIVTKDVYYAYLQRENSIMHSLNIKKELTYLDIFDKRFVYFNKKYNGKYDAVILYHAIIATLKNIFGGL